MMPRLAPLLQEWLLRRGPLPKDRLHHQLTLARTLGRARRPRAHQL